MNNFENADNRYAKDWNAYSKTWDDEFGSSYSYLGEEWNDDGTAERQRDKYYFTIYAERFITSDMTVLEVGPGGGKWTVRIAPKVKKVIVLDVSEEMLQRTKLHCESLGIKNVEYILANGNDFHAIPNESINFFFSYDVFVHIALEDTFPYAQEMYRILTPGSMGVCHYAINSVPEAWDRIAQNNNWYRGGKHTLGQFYYFSPEALRRMFEHCGLLIKEQHQEGCHCTCIFQKPTGEKQYPSQLKHKLAELERLPSQLQKTQEELHRSHSWIQELQQGKDWLESQYHTWKEKAQETQTELESCQFKLQKTQEELERSQSLITAIESSKFLKLRTAWFRFKQFIFK